MHILTWLLRGFIFFALFAFATPSWWRHRRRAKRLETPLVVVSAPIPAAPPAPDVTAVRDGL